MGNLTSKAYENGYYGDEDDGVPVERFITLMKVKVREWHVVLKALEKGDGEKNQEQLNMLLRDSHLLLQEFVVKGISFTHNSEEMPSTATTSDACIAPTERPTQISQNSVTIQTASQPPINAPVSNEQRLTTRSSSSSSCQGLLYNKQTECVAPVTNTQVRNDHTDEVFVIDKVGFPRLQHVPLQRNSNNDVEVKSPVHSSSQNQDMTATINDSIPTRNIDRNLKASGSVKSTRSGNIETSTGSKIDLVGETKSRQRSEAIAPDINCIVNEQYDTGYSDVTMIGTGSDKRINKDFHENEDISGDNSSVGNGNPERERLTSVDSDIVNDPNSEAPFTTFK